MVVNGYVVQNEKGEYLARTHYWYDHECPEDAWVHSATSMEWTRKASVDWDIKPTTKTRATYSPKTGTVILGEPKPF